MNIIGVAKLMGPLPLSALEEGVFICSAVNMYCKLDSPVEPNVTGSELEFILSKLTNEEIEILNEIVIVPDHEKVSFKARILKAHFRNGKSRSESIGGTINGALLLLTLISTLYTLHYLMINALGEKHPWVLWLDNWLTKVAHILR